VASKRSKFACQNKLRNRSGVGGGRGRTGGEDRSGEFAELARRPYLEAEDICKGGGARGWTPQGHGIYSPLLERADVRVRAPRKCRRFVQTGELPLLVLYTLTEWAVRPTPSLTGSLTSCNPTLTKPAVTSPSSPSLDTLL
jgi:hypothetical protein